MDLYFFRLINQLAFNSPWLDIFAVFCAKYLGYLLVIILLFFLIIRFKKYLRLVIEAFISALLARLVFVEIIRWLFPKNRPFIGTKNVNLLIDAGHIHHSFPSGHAAFFFAISTLVYFYNKKTGIWFLVASLFIIIARVFVGVHWPSDVLAGALVGIFSGWLVFFISKKMKLYKK